MTPDQKHRLETFRDASRSEKLDIIFSYEMSVKLATDAELRESFQQTLDILWPEYLIDIRQG